MKQQNLRRAILSKRFNNTSSCWCRSRVYHNRMTLGRPRMTMSDHERLLWVFAENLERSIDLGFKQSTDPAEWVDGQDEAEALMRRMRGIFVASLVGETEERVGRNFSSIIEQLPDTPTQKNSKYWFVDMPRTSTPRGRAKVMWAIRIAYTHGNGHKNQISDATVASFIDPSYANKHFRGVRIKSDIVTLFKDVTFPALKTVLEIADKFPQKSVSGRPKGP